jgi:hypothetical protein
VAGHQVTLALPSAALTQSLGDLLDWARARQVPLAGLSVGRPALEDAYLELTAGPAAGSRP